ncbi:pyridoxal-dependent decarboxylase domain-containing protein 1-like isoform X2 [Ornithodoros turicata]|uniref:pyridoxal-dependent decarboxylase domain-containing protein 1-like isoform X2 n=1 Tax=Ornithodoros turicata TaxID=34597 RepID=UPI003138FB72
MAEVDSGSDESASVEESEKTPNMADSSRKSSCSQAATTAIDMSEDTQNTGEPGIKNPTAEADAVNNYPTGRDVGPALVAASAASLGRLQAAANIRSRCTGGGDEATAPAKRAPGPLQPNPRTLEEIEECLSDLLFCNDSEKGLGIVDGRDSGVPALDQVEWAVVASHSLAAFVATLDMPLLRAVTLRMVADVRLWMSQLFRWPGASLYLHRDAGEGLARVCRQALHARFSWLVSDGYFAFQAHQPVLYFAACYKSGLRHYLCSQLGLPTACARVVPYGTDSRMNVEALKQLVEGDLERGFTPTVLVASAGQPWTGLWDPLVELQELCRQHKIWLHVEGPALASLFLEQSTPKEASPSEVPWDSAILPLGDWFGVRGLPYVTLFGTSCAPADARAAGLDAFSVHGSVECLPLWVALQALGEQGAVARVRHCFALTELLVERLQQVSCIKILGCGSAEARSASPGLHIPVANAFPVVTFQYVWRGSETAGDAPEGENPAYLNDLNSWLGQMLCRDLPRVPLDLLELKQHGVCLCFCPIENAQASYTTMEDLDALHSALLKQLFVINATVRQKRKFRACLTDHVQLEYVGLKGWAGLGGVRYLPDTASRHDVNRLNAELVAKLKHTDSAFSLGKAEDGSCCVRLGMVTDDLDVEELVGLVLSAGQELEESSKALETMSELVKQGIEEASRELQQENKEKQEGILRHVPLVGSLFGWWAAKESVRGRTFNISSGVVESTENIYKYHMQVQAEEPRLEAKPEATLQQEPQVVQ